MKCYLCGKPTNKFLYTCHQECADKLYVELDVMYNVIKDYNVGRISVKTAKIKLINAAMTDYIQTHFGRNIWSKSKIRTYDKVIFSQRMIRASEEKNRCKMERTGLSYARYPQWNVQSMRICNDATVVLTDSGIYLLDMIDFYIPYNKIVDSGVEKGFSFNEVYFDVKTSSPHRHRYCLWSVDKKDKEFAGWVCQIIRVMAAVGTK